MSTTRSRGRPLAGRVALVTGAAHGIGKATALALAEKGSDVALVDIDGKASRVAVKQIAEATGRRIIAVVADVTMLPRVRRAVRRVLSAFGRLDILVNNAGIWEFDRLADVKEADWDRVLSVNLHGTLFCTQAVIPIMRKQGAGKIVNIASAVGLQPSPQWSAYCISKAAVVMLSRVAAEELKPDNLQVHCLCPGAVDTDLARSITRLTGAEFPHAMRPEQVAEAVADLVIPFGSSKTGRIVALYGGVCEEVHL